MSKSSSNSDSANKKMVKEALAYQRKCLKIHLWQERSVDVTAWDYQPVRTMRPVCPYCDGPIYDINEAAMHEWLIKRSDLPVLLQCRIMHRFNCVLAHHECHDQHGQTREFMLRCAKAQYQRHGRDTIMAWVKSLKLKQLVEVPLRQECASCSFLLPENAVNQQIYGEATDWPICGRRGTPFTGRHVELHGTCAKHGMWQPGPGRQGGESCGK